MISPNGLGDISRKSMLNVAKAERLFLLNSFLLYVYIMRHIEKLHRFGLSLEITVR